MEPEKARLNQARQSLDEARALFDAEMDTGFVLTNVYYAFYYPILALMDEGQAPTAMQSVVIGLFEQRFVMTGILKKGYYDSVRRIFSIKPKCNGEITAVSKKELKELLDLAGSFIHDVENCLDRYSLASSQEGNMVVKERRNGNSKTIRSGNERRVEKDPNYKGPERRRGDERRSDKDRRKKS